MDHEVTSRLALCSETIPEEAAIVLAGEGFEVVLLPPHPNLHPPVSSHADILTCYVDGSLFVDGVYYDEYKDSGWFEKITKRCRVVRTDEGLGPVYPQDAVLNVLVGDRFAAGHKSASSGLVTAIEGSGRLFIPVKQGYSACSCLMAKDVLISADRGILKALSGYCRTLEISEGNIDLSPFPTGFIGGASGFDGERVYFVGDPVTHPDGGRITEFLGENGIEYIKLTGGRLTDVGGIRFI